jgi:hypothetical protein
MPTIPNPSRLAMTIAVSQELWKKLAMGDTKHTGGGSVPSSGILPSSDNHLKADVFKSNLK